ncbi:phosphopantothenoylcysteine decarboxylase / phosphopantothenate--cysteine ligase [Streptosporangium subroseum]|uniref:Phosphopantothenoylcysteine decarboxylase / phosphopantothenate--cysteine ligase n=2 Tax=Streptosporangium subroseum TaxID=106412 RepID=A0A239L3M4_9ACTN|nr:phosphopantothenoylcysteine decarboxylase / phosphopantothenate--cysteine ligase [Streptosporangium subroseum]
MTAPTAQVQTDMTAPATPVQTDMTAPATQVQTGMTTAAQVQTDMTAPATEVQMDMTAAAQVQVDRFGTGLLQTTISAVEGGGFVWTRYPGPLAPAPFSAANPEPDARLAAIGTAGGARLVPGLPRGEARIYHVAGEQSVAGHLLREGLHPDLEPALRGMGCALAALHALTPSYDRPPSTSRGLVRIDDWLKGRALQVRAAQAGAVLRERLGPARWSTLRAWSARAVEDGDVVLAHGAPGLGSLVLDPSSGVAELLIGEDLCATPWYADLGWVIGEIVELTWQLGGEPRLWQRLTDALVDGYGRDLGAEWNHMAAVRIALHLHDYTAYVGWNPSEVERYASFLGFLIDL